MRHDRENGHRAGGFTALIVFAAFAVCILSVLLAGADAYRRITERDRAAYAGRTCAQYIATRVRQAQSGAAVSVTGSGGVRAIAIRETINDELYVTRVYCYDGWLRELFSADGTEFDPEDGEAVIEADEMEPAISDGLLTVALTANGGERTELVLSLRGEEGSS